MSWETVTPSQHTDMLSIPAREVLAGVGPISLSRVDQIHKSNDYWLLNLYQVLSKCWEYNYKQTHALRNLLQIMKAGSRTKRPL